MRGSPGGQIAAAERRMSLEDAFARQHVLRSRRQRFRELAGRRELPPKRARKAIDRRHRYREMIANLPHWLAPETMGRSSSIQLRNQSGQTLEGLVQGPWFYVMSLESDLDGTLVSAEALPGVLEVDIDSTLFIPTSGGNAIYLGAEVEELLFLPS